MLRRCSSAAVILALALADPAIAQDRGFPDFPDTPLADDALQLVVYDGTQTDLLDRERRQSVAVMLSGVRAEIAATLTAAEVFPGAGIDIYRTGGAVTVVATGPTRFVELTDTPGAITAVQCLQGNAAGNQLVFAACGSPDTDTHVEIRAGAGTSIRMNPAYVLFTGNRVLVSSAGTDGAVVNIIGPLIYDEGSLLVADPTVLDFTGAGVTTAVNTVSGLVTIDIPAGGMADGVATAGAYDSTDEEIDFTVTTPGANFSVDVSALVGGGGSGDITGITTEMNSGLAGGCTTGNCTLTFSPAGLPRYGTTEVLARSDDFIFKNESEFNSPHLLSYQDFLEEIIGNRMELNANFRSIDVRADYRGVATLTSSAYLTGDIVRESASSARFWLLAGTAGDFTAQEIIASGSGWVRITTGTQAAKAYRGTPPLTLTQYESGDIVEFSSGALYIYTGTDNVEFASNTIATSTDWTQFDGSGGGGGGITQTAADARYVNVAGDTMTGTLNVTPATNAVALFLDARAATTQTPFVFNMNASGNQQAMWLRRGGSDQAFLTIDGNIGGGNANPGFALGPGGPSGVRDVLIYRGGADTLTTPNAFLAGTLGLEVGTLNSQTLAQRLIATQTNIGLNDACVILGVAGTTLTCTQADGGAATVTLPSGGGSALTVTDGTTSVGSTAQITFAGATVTAGSGTDEALVTITPAPDGTGVTNIIGPGMFTAAPATLAFAGNVVMSQSSDVTTVTVTGGGGGGITQVESDATLTGTGVSGDALSVANPPATFAYATGASGFIQDANVPASIARDSEIPTIVQGTGIAIAVTAPNSHTISLVDPTDDTGVTTITATGSSTTPGTVHFAGNVTVAASGTTTTVTVLDTGGVGEPAAPTRLAHVANLANLDVQGAGAIRTISLSPDLSTILDDDWVEIWFRHGTNADEVLPEPLQIRAAILKDLASTTGSNENLDNPNEWIGIEIGRMAGNNLSYFGHGSLYIGRDQTNLRLAMSLNNQGTSPSIVTITHVPRGGPAGIAGPAGAAGRGITTITAVGARATVTYTDATTEIIDLPAGQTGATGAAGPTGPAGAAGSTTFLALTDVTPTSFVDQGRKQVSVNVAEDALVFTDFGDTVNEIMNTNSIESNDRWFIYDESEGLPRHVHHSVMQTLMADGLGVATITGESTFSETPGTLRLTGSGVSLAEAGGVVTATITGGAASTALTKAQADSGSDTTEGLVSGLLLYDAITTHAHEFGIPEVGRIPATETAPVLYLTHDYQTGSRSDRTITPAALGTVYYGWSTGRNLTAGGSVANNDSMGCLTAISGPSVSGTTWSPNRIWSTNRACMESFTHIVINGASYPPSTLTFSDLGLYWREIGSSPTLTAGDAFTFNLRITPFLPATYYFEDGTDVTYPAGLYAWEGTPASYVLLTSTDTFAGDIHTITATGTSGMTATEASGTVTLNLDLSRLTDLTVPFPAAGILGVDTTTGQGQGTVQELATAIAPLLGTTTFDIYNLPAPDDGEIQGNDRIPFGDADATDNPSVRILVSELGAFFTNATNSGLTINTAGQFAVDLDDLVRETGALEGDDLVVVVDSGETGDPSDAVTLQHFGDYYAGTGLTAHMTSGVLSVDTVPLTRGGTGAITAAAARTALQIVPNPTAASTDTLEKILIGTTVYRHGHPHKGVYSATAIYQQGDIIETGTGINSIFWIAREVISAGQGEPANDDLGLWWRAAGHGYFRGTLEDAQMYDIYSGDYYISDNELWVAFQTLADRTGTELAGNIDGMDRLLNEIIIRSDGQAPLDSSDNTLTVDHLNEIDFRGAGVEVLAINDTYGQSVAVTIAGGVADNSVGSAQVLTGRGNATIMSGTPVRLNCLSFTPLLAGSGSGIYFTVFAPVPAAPTSTECVEPGYSAQFGTIQAWWDYLTASDNPALWVMLDASGDVASFWESEDPLPSGAPMSVPAGSAFTVLDIGLPTFTVAERLYTVVLTADQRETTLSTWGAYLVERGWLDTLPTTLVDPVTMVTARYQPSAVQWLMRFMAQAAGEITSAFYTDNLVVSGGAWARP